LAAIASVVHTIAGLQLHCMVRREAPSAIGSLATSSGPMARR
jgi:hypothetical protein